MPSRDCTGAEFCLVFLTCLCYFVMLILHYFITCYLLLVIPRYDPPWGHGGWIRKAQNKGPCAIFVGEAIRVCVGDCPFHFLVPMKRCPNGLKIVDDPSPASPIAHALFFFGVANFSLTPEAGGCFWRNFLEVPRFSFDFRDARCSHASLSLVARNRQPTPSPGISG